MYNKYWRRIKRLLIWLFGQKPEVVYDETCPTCGPMESPSCDEADPECQDVRTKARLLLERYDYIYTKNKHKGKKRKSKEDCAPAAVAYDLINSKNRCKYAGAVQTYKGITYVCMECVDCDGSDGNTGVYLNNNPGLDLRADSNQTGPISVPTGDSGQTGTISLPTGDCMLDKSCPEAECGYWYYVNNMVLTNPLGHVSIEGREARNRVKTSDSAPLTIREGCNYDICDPRQEGFCGEDCDCYYFQDNSFRCARKDDPNTPGTGDPVDPGDPGDPNEIDLTHCKRCCLLMDYSDDQLKEFGWGYCVPCRKICESVVTPGVDPGQNGSTGCAPELIYDSTGCKVIGVKPVILARGALGYWESTEKYPMTKDCEGEYIYGSDAGKPIRHHLMPSAALEPHFMSFQSGVVSHLDPGNKEWGNSYARFVRLEITGVPIPLNPPKPLSQTEPYTFMIIPRDEGNKSVRASGLYVNTFMGVIHGEKFAVPKNGVNSLEYFDKNIYYGGTDSHRGGENMDEGAMVFFSPDTEFNRPALTADTVKLELPLFGKGMRHGMCASGDRPESAFVSRENAKGTIQSVNLNHYMSINRHNLAINKCVVDVSYAPANSIVDKGSKFTYPLLNLYRESSVYIEVKDGPVVLHHPRSMTSNNNGHPGKSLGYDGTSDYSFLGDTLYHMCPIHYANGWYGSLKTFMPAQYGGLVRQTYREICHVSWKELESGRIKTSAGDSFINIHSLVRKSYVSDKIMKDISPLAAGGGFAGGGRLWSKLMRNLFETIGLEECGTCPDSGDPSDPRNSVTERGPSDAIREYAPGQCWNGLGNPPEPTQKDIYFPNVQKTLIWYIVQSDVNLHFRETGSVDAGEVHAKSLKGLNHSSEYPLNSNWKIGFLNRFYVISKEMTKWQMILRVTINFCFTYGIGLVLIVWLFTSAIGAIDDMNISWTNFNIGWIIAGIMGIGSIGIGIAWIILWASSDLDNKAWDAMLGIDGCRPDITEYSSGSGGRTASAHRIRDGRVKNFEDNYFSYNYDHSRGNHIVVSSGMPDPYSTCVCPWDTTYEILYSNKQNPLSPTDAYRNFKVNNYLEIPSDTGKLKEMFLMGNKVFVRTSDMLYSLQTGTKQIQLNSEEVAWLGSGDVLGDPLPWFGGLKEGRGGTNDPNASVSTRWGRISIDVEARSIFIFDGSNYREIGAEGMKRFLDKHMPFTGTGIRDEKTPNGVGYSIGVDNELSLIHITKQDVKPWTLTFDMESESWVCWEFFSPLVYIWDRHKAYSFDKNKLWRHNEVGVFQNVYGKTVEMLIDFVIRSQEDYEAFQYESTEVYSEFDEYDGVGYVKKDDVFFTETGAYNGYQSSGLMPLIYSNDMPILQRNIQDDTIILYSNLHRNRRFNELIDRALAKGGRMFSSLDEDIYTDFKEEVLDDRRVDDKLIDNHLVQRLRYHGREDIKIILRGIRTNIQTEIK